MEQLIFITILFYMMSTAMYFIHLFFQKDHLNRTGYYLLVAGFLCHTAAVGYGTVISGYIPVYNLRGTLFVAGWAIAGVFLLSKYKFNLKVLGIYAAPLTTLLVIVAFMLPDTPIFSTVSGLLYIFLLFLSVKHLWPWHAALDCFILFRNTQ